MGGYNPSQVAFNAGELSPRLAGRVDSDLYKAGLKTCLDFCPTPHGSLLKRQGAAMMRNLSSLDGASLGVRIIPFRMSTGSDYLVELLNGSMKLLDVTGTPVSVDAAALSVEVVTNGDFTQTGGTGWSTSGDAAGVTFSPTTPTFYYNKSSHAGAYSPQSARLLRRGDHSDVVVYQQITIPATGAYKLQFRQRLHSEVPAITLPGGGVIIPVGGQQVANQWANPCRIRVAISTSSPSGWGNKLTGGGEACSWDGVPADMTFAGDTITLASGTYYLSFSFSATNPTGYQDAQLDLDDFSLQAVSSSVSTVTSITTPWTSAQVGQIQYASLFGSNTLVLVHPNVKPFFLSYNQANGKWSFGDIALVAQPDTWGGTNWPSVIEYHEGRLWLAATPTEPQRLWASRPGNPYDFTLADKNEFNENVVTASNAIDLKVSTKGAIRWLKSGRSLLLGTDLGEHAIVAQSGPISPLDCEIKAASWFGGAATQGAYAGHQALYVSRDGKRLRGIEFDWTAQNWKSRDLLLQADHITQAWSIKEVHVAADPWNTIFILTADGRVYAANVDPESGRVGWWRLSFSTGTGEKVCSLAITRGDIGSFLWAAVSRVGSYSLVGLESIFLGEYWLGGQDSGPNVYLDSWIIGGPTQSGGVTRLSGLGHLEGKAVKAVSYTGEVADATVSGGQIVLPTAWYDYNALVVAGLPFTSRARTLKLEGGLKEGSAQSARRRWTKVRLRLNDSAIPLLNGKRAAERFPADPLDTGTDLTTDDVDYQDLGWDQDGELLIEQDLPLRTEILALFGTATAQQV
jgi:hypothetical protein